MHHGQLGLAAAAHHRHHPVAEAEALDPGADFHDLAGELDAGHVGGHAGWRRIKALTLEHVGSVEAGGAHGHEQLAGAGGGVGVLAPNELAVDDRHRVHARAAR